ncbi:cell growth-regulating nucleolar protein [Paramormyrops kingsleyae]|uniref:Cell growth-regulating nucleolar protein n=1 Tax=Paramormyrops kingsleyae TaxID=1676925 RepID=A0A3B3RLC3_9TELE|nr:cell growth-regulating nucleolar protein isoform X2 [Paramormyrops kingsleyae]
MVFFTCNACGESLKKAQVDKHVFICKGCEVLSCIDCGKDFWGDDYKSHTQCISEDQKYGGKGFEAKSKKGDVKQQQWIQRIHEAMNKPGINPKLKDVLNQVSSYENVPRKKAKFQNWMKNSLKIHSTALQDQVWEIFSAASGSQAESESQWESESQQESEPQRLAQDKVPKMRQNGSGAPLQKKSKREHKEDRRQRPGLYEIGVEAGDGGDSTERTKKKKRKRGEEESWGDRRENSNAAEGEGRTKKRKKHKSDGTGENLLGAEDEEKAEEDEGQPSSKGTFNWKGTMKAILRQSPEEGISIKKLKKKVLAEYYTFTGEGNFRSEEELMSLFNKKVNNNPKFRVLKDKVRLVK